MYNKIIKIVYSFKRNIPIQVIIVLVLTIAFGECISEDIKRVLYSMSFILKEVLLLILPLVVFCCAYVSVSTIKHKKSIGIFLLLLFVAIYFYTRFFIQMQHSGLLSKTIEKLVPLIVLISGTYIFYLSFLFAVIANFNLRLWISYIKNVIPAALTGFYTMSSLVTMPITIMSTEKNIKNPEMVRLVIPIATNIPMIVLAINIPMMALIILLTYGYELPTFTVYLIFAFNFALMQFAAAGAPGCGVLLMLPLLEKYLGFTNEMSALIVAIYILFDATETSANVIGNSALAVVFSKLAKVLRLSCYSSSKLEDNNVC